MKILLACISLSLISVPQAKADGGAGDLQITSTAFENNAPIPKKYTCNGQDVNPQLSIKNVTYIAQSLVLTVTDPDAPEGNWTHWIVYNLPTDTVEIKENSDPASEGLNDFGKSSYRGPCPPDEKVHHYIFRLMALNTTLSLNEAPSYTEVEKAIQGHVLAKAEWVGTYQK